MSEIFKRQPDETNKAYSAFCKYRDFGPDRSIAKVVKKLGKKPGYARQMEEWSSKFNWIERTKAFDDKADEKRRVINEQSLASYDRAFEAHIKNKMLIAKTTQEIFAVWVNECLSISALKPADIAILMKLGSSLEREAITDIEELKKNDISKLSIDNRTIIDLCSYISKKDNRSTINKGV